MDVNINYEDLIRVRKIATELLDIGYIIVDMSSYNEWVKNKEMIINE